MKTLNVLRVDFDFFQNVSADTMIHCYPDGVDLPTELTVMTWSQHYSHEQTEKRLLEVTPKTDMIEELTALIHSNCKIKTPVMVANSHVHAYKFIKDLIEKYDAQHVRIANIDMHHDCYNGTGELDCGNWIGYAMEDFPDCKVQWIANQTSKDIYEFTDDEFIPAATDFEPIKNVKFDAVFICRSDTWLPPHLDDAFNTFLYDIVAVFPNNFVEKSVQHPRDLTEAVAMQKRIMEEWKVKRCS